MRQIDMESNPRNGALKGLLLVVHGTQGRIRGLKRSIGRS